MRFSEIPGNSDIKNKLRELVDNDEMPHALMIHGISGIGKMMTARAFVQYAQCQNRKDGEPCGRCQSCLQHQSLNNPDLHFSYPIVKSAANNILTSVDRLPEWRKMLDTSPAMIFQDWLEIIDAGNSQPAIHVNEADWIIRSEAYSTFSSKYKFYIIWLPEKMNVEAANKLLKIIEEPSNGTVFILVSNNEGEVLPTISSRTRKFNMLPVSENDLENYLISKYGISSDSAYQLAHISEGSIAKADQLATHSGEREEFQKLYQDIMRAAFGKKPLLLRQLADSSAAFGREKTKRFLLYMSEMTRENFIYNLGVPSLISMTQSEQVFSSKFSPFIHHANIEQIQKEIEKAILHISRNGNSKLIMFSFFLYLIPLLHKAK